MAKADEIKFDYKDKNRIYDLIEENEIINSHIYIYVPKEEEIDWNFFNSLKESFNFTFIVENIDTITAVREQNYRVFWAFPIYTYVELRGLITMGVSEVLLDAPLYFDLPQVKEVCGDVEIRLIANQCMNSNIPQQFPERGTYIRPEDIKIYEKYVSHIEFKTDSLTKEKTLIEIYKSGVWNGNLNLLLNDLHFNIDNRLFDVDFANRRIKCRHRCYRDDSCHLCSSQFMTYEAIRKNKDWLEQQFKD